MKKKNITYLLLIVVVGLWGGIAYRIYAAVHDDATVIYTAPAPVKASYNDYEMPKDTAKLHLNYGDPFKITAQKDTAGVAQPARTHQRPVSPAGRAVNWGFITYSGYLRNAGSKKLIAIVRINGVSKMLAEGEGALGVRLIKNLKDSIRVSYGGAAAFIPLKTSAQ